MVLFQLNSSIPAGDDWAPVQLAREFDTSVANQGVIIGWGRLYVIKKKNTFKQFQY